MISSTVCRQGPSKEDENMQLAANKLTLCASQAQAQHNTRHVHVRNEILIGLDFGVRSSFGGAAVEEYEKSAGARWFSYSSTGHRRIRRQRISLDTATCFCRRIRTQAASKATKLVNLVRHVCGNNRQRSQLLCQQATHLQAQHATRLITCPVRTNPLSLLLNR